MSVYKELQSLHKHLQAKGILSEEVELHFDENLINSFAPHGFGEYEEPSIFINLLENRYGENIVDVYLHEAGHAMHFFNDLEDWDEKDEVYEIFYMWGVELHGEHSPAMREYYQQMPLEKEANEFAAILIEDLGELYEQVKLACE